MNDKKIVIRGAREHNLKSVNLEIPRNKLISNVLECENFVFAAQTEFAAVYEVNC